jgi:hypothetical protein
MRTNFCILCEHAAKERDELMGENARLRSALERVVTQEHSRGYPTGAEWDDRVRSARAALEGPAVGEGK